MTPSTAKRKVLLIDDDEGILNSMTRLLELQGYEVLTCARDVKVFIMSLFKNGTLPDVIILDILLSGEDGRTIVKDLRNTLVHIPIIMTSALPNAKESALDSGATHFIAKPFEIKAFLEVLKATHGKG